MIQAFLSSSFLRLPLQDRDGYSECILCPSKKQGKEMEILAVDLLYPVKPKQPE